MSQVTATPNKTFEQAKENVEKLTQDIEQGICWKTEKGAFILVQNMKAASTTINDQTDADNAAKRLWRTMDLYCENLHLGNRLYADYLSGTSEPADINLWSENPITPKSSAKSTHASIEGSQESARK
jgi:hypothetical protein